MVIETIKQQLGADTANKEGRYLLAVSTGIDSMVLLSAVEKMFAHIADRPFAVAHIDHQLRDASKEEAGFLREYCADRHIPFYETQWNTAPSQGVEAAARTFRYDFFARIMETHGYSHLVTAHHGDDQVETMLMKMMRDGSLINAFGIRQQQIFGSGLLLRPMLTLTKEEIHRYATTHQVPFFEDETNEQDIYLRNRIRQQVLPVLKKENPQTSQHFQQLSEEMIYGQQLIAEKQKEWLDRYVVKCDDAWEVSLAGIAVMSEADRYFFFSALLQQVQFSEHIQVKQKQLRQIIQLLDNKKGQWQLDLGDHWMIRRSYDMLRIEQHTLTDSQTHSSKTEKWVTVGTGIFLSETEWVGYFPRDKIEIPKKITNWSEFSQELRIDYGSELLVRKRKPGDRLQMQKNMHKKISRFFIDRKVPNEEREKSWVVTTPNQEVVALLPHVFSYLSIGAETDKIHYILLYKYQE